ncbi:DUF4011 domain-containing protein [Micrococcus luteus]|uniref:DUF4011 domain-containing protein n=1 Tax=Micrococcus luteus TaxID=1270 RepID=UPI000E04BB33|nr:DUF4011 domain-containing protein [Micrococcus luteus]STY68572.1 putative DNA helicase [Micrococcus luteus]
MTEQEFPRLARARAAARPDEGQTRPDPAAWVSSLGSGAENDTMLRFAPSAANSIDLTEANSSGVSQLLLGRRTRLSTLLPAGPVLDAAHEVSLGLRAKVRELAEERGIDVGALAVGVATWTAEEDGRRERRSAPVLLARVALTVRRGARGRDELEVQITEPARLNPALVRNLRRHHGIALDPEAYQQAAYATARLEPAPAFARLREETAAIADLHVEDCLLVSTFADLGETASLPASLEDLPVVQALYDAGTGMVPRPAALQPTGAPAEDDVAPADERLVVDVDAAQARVLEHAAAGESLVVAAAPGTGQTQTAAALAARLAWEGRRVLVVAERSAALADVLDRLEEADLRSIALDVPANADPELLRRQLVQAVLRSERAVDPDTARDEAALTERRRRLQEHVGSLHHVRPRWGCSPFQAMQALAALTGLETPPATTVRLKRSVLDSTVNRQAVGEQLVRAGELGAFSAAATESRWFGARVRNVQETEAASELADELAAALHTTRRAVDTAAAQAGLRPERTVAGWAEQADLYRRVARTLTEFTPEVFSLDVPQLVAATATSAWRRLHLVEMSSVTRSRLRRAAKDAVRPGVQPTDLHGALVDAAAVLEDWNRHAAEPGTPPQVPDQGEHVMGHVGQVREHLRRLEGVLAPEAVAEGPLDERDVDDLVAAVDGLVADRDTLATLPERTLVLDSLRDHGLAELLEDLRDREVPTEALTAELELAWWQSALEAMISGDDFLAMMSGADLAEVERGFRDLDRAHLERGGARLSAALAARWREALRTYRADAAVLRTLLKQGSPTVESLATITPELLQPLVPVLTTSPMALSEFPPEWRADVVVLLEADATALATAMGALTRAPQVVALGDPVIGRPQSFQVSVDPTATAGPLRPLRSAYDALDEVLPTLPLRTVHRPLERRLVRLLSALAYDGALDALPTAGEATGRDRAVTAEYLPEGTGIPMTGGDVVESTNAEVARTVERVFEHIRDRPEQSLAVVTVSEQHARRVAAAVQATAAQAPWAHEFLARGRGEDAAEAEPFVIVPVVRAASVVRDAVILTPGYGRTPHGRVVHHFGAFSNPDGERMVTVALTRARRRLHLVSALRAADLDEDRLDGGALWFLRLLEAYLGDDAADPVGMVGDPLLADLRDRLEEQGARVLPRYAGVMDLAVLDPRADQDEAPRPLALAGDGGEVYRALTVRQRSRTLPEGLEARGWEPRTLWSIDVFADPESVARELADRLGVEPADETDETDDDAR